MSISLFIKHIVIAKMVSDSEKANSFLPLGIHAVSISPSPASHVYSTLDTVGQADDKGVAEGIYGKDVMVWGCNGTQCLFDRDQWLPDKS